MPRMRTINEAARYVKATDPETALTETAIRRLLITGAVPSVRVGVKYLIDRVGHEPAAAEGEVRRSVSGGYGPLYQAAYMLGGLQIRALHDELVVPGSKWTERAFHDAVLRQNAMPIAVLRAALQGELPPRQLPVWRFAD